LDKDGIIAESMYEHVEYPDRQAGISLVGGGTYNTVIPELNNMEKYYPVNFFRLIGKRGRDIQQGTGPADFLRPLRTPTIPGID
jgi:hypothetical protein